MAQTITYAQFRQKILADMDLEQEQFISPSELIGYTNTAITDAEALIHGLYEDYFLKTDSFDLVNGQQEYDLPTDIYADKLRRVLLNIDNATSGRLNKYRIQQIKQFDRTLDIDTEDRYRYILINSSAGNRKMRFYPIPTQTTTGGGVIRFYIRQANRVDPTESQATIDATLMDIPEFQSFLYAHVKYQIARKEKLGQDIQVYGGLLGDQKKLMEETLTSRTPDEDNHIGKDLSYYFDFYYNDENYFNI